MPERSKAQPLYNEPSFFMSCFASTTRECGATEATIETERKKLEDLQALLFQDFRRDLLEMLKRKGDRVSGKQGNLGT